MKDKKTAERGRNDLKEAKKQLESINKNPFLIGAVEIHSEHAAVGSFGPLASDKATVLSVDGDATEILMPYTTSTYSGGGGFSVGTTSKHTSVGRIIIRNAPFSAKPKSEVKLKGVWYVVDEIKREGKRIPIVEQIEIKPEEMPGKGKQ